MINLPKQSILNTVGKHDVYAGSAKKLGPSFVKGVGVNFAVYCPKAHKVELCLFDKDTEQQICAIELPAKKGRVWHGLITNIEAGQLYGYRVYGDYNLDMGLVFDHEKLLIDPYAKALNRPLVWNERLYAGDSAAMMAKCVVVDPEFDWQGITRPYVPDSDTVVYEMHVKGFTQIHPDVPESMQGTYAGLAHPKVIKYLKDLGVTTLQLMPVAAFMSEPRLTDLGLTNYWGYNPINFFSPEPRYASNGDSVAEFKTMIREMHRAGIEVILDVVFNHSAEGGGDGPILSFRGLDNRNFYLFDKNEHGHKQYRSYVNNTGCGNSINLDNPYVLQLVTQSLRYWVEEMQVDGFRFDLAVSLAREGNEFDNYSAFFKVLFQDPVLSQVKLIAEPWDIGYGGYRLGQFPENWHECNDKFRDTVRGFWKGDRHLLGDFATRLMGSRDVFHKDLRTINTSVNYIAYHDGFTLEDLVCYNHKHNEANCEHNRDGHGHNLSYNYGIEGPTKNKKINALRQKQKRNLLATLFVSQGTPHLLAGDEIGRTQLGNNNAYCQDNSISWINWQLKNPHKQQLEFVQNLIKLRHGSELLHSLSLKDDGYFGYNNSHEVHWYTPENQEMNYEDWHDIDNQSFMVELIAGLQEGDETLRLMINASELEVEFTLPSKSKWQILFDTRFDNGQAKRKTPVSKKYLCEDRSMVLLQKKW
ncbi:glycogen debranching enzyme GlgX [Saccharobesus litoralis]|uniref:Glycogen debranching enzyme GlgX n=1 Tax=Saccharobesus litoralis TaxID=2172099 RepID=A0A2S0VTZ8_9ALTE|nr:glycogen debranching protein GlgX [Saccharobesus litoralis]AWB67691.1 glycogen debranching enzyme GlgX [Saccharobesus litoralis]